MGFIPLVQVIDLSNNYLIEIPSTFASFEELWILYLDNNSLYCFDGVQDENDIPDFLLNPGLTWISGLFFQDCSVAGCTDSEAYNYLPEMIVNDGSCYYSLEGDINHDTFVDILDIVLMVDIIVNGILPDEFILLTGDLSEDGELNILDVVILVQLILG